MKIRLIIVSCLFVSLKLYAQAYYPPIFFNGIDTFFIADNKSKFIKSNTPSKFSLIQTDTLKKNIVSFYSYNKDSIIPYRIDTITFRNMLFTFSDSILASINFLHYYFTKDYENPVAYVDSKMKIIKKYISKQLHKKGKVKNFSTDVNYLQYGYEWKKGDYSIILSVGFDIPKSKAISLDLYFSNKKLEDFY